MAVGHKLRSLFGGANRDFYHKLRGLLIWDADLYDAFDDALKEVLTELQGKRSIPRWVASTFAWRILAICEFARRDDLIVTRGGAHVEDGRAEIERGIQRLRTYQAWLDMDRDPTGGRM